jgi:hypothetical protein
VLVALVGAGLALAGVAMPLTFVVAIAATSDRAESAIGTGHQPV